jgi:hypothetical protein
MIIFNHPGLGTAGSREIFHSKMFSWKQHAEKENL